VSGSGTEDLVERLMFAAESYEPAIQFNLSPLLREAAGEITRTQAALASAAAEAELAHEWGDRWEDACHEAESRRDRYRAAIERWVAARDAMRAVDLDDDDGIPDYSKAAAAWCTAGDDLVAVLGPLPPTQPACASSVPDGQCEREPGHAPPHQHGTMTWTSPLDEPGPTETNP
jgi:hypothetical protein